MKMWREFIDPRFRYLGTVWSGQLHAMAALTLGKCSSGTDSIRGWVSLRADLDNIKTRTFYYLQGLEIQVTQYSSP
jgi:hypothetical protein